MVLTQPMNVEKFYIDLEVSIPLWFSRNSSQQVDTEQVSRFHTTMVLTQRDTKKSTFCTLSGFHTTMVLTQQACGTRLKPVLRSFHTTMVLTQPKQPIYQGLLITVSIPLWFSRNSFYYRNYTGLGEGKSNLSSSFAGKTFRVRIRVSWVSEIMYFGSTLDL